MSPLLHQYSLMERVLHDQRAAEALPGEVRRHGSSRAFIVSTASLAQSPRLREIAEALGPTCAGVYTGVRAHAPRDSVMAGAVAARQAKADLLIAIGGGSVIDAAKVMLLVLRHGYTHAEQLDVHAGAPWNTETQRPRDHAHWLRMMAVPTTFSAAEYTSVGGATEPKTKAKQAFGSQMMMPVAVVNDPVMTLTAPLDLLLATGMKAVDHAVERLTSNRANLYSDTVSAVALSLLSRNLPALRRDPSSLAVRGELQYGVFLSMAGIASGTRSNLAHAIAHAMGSLCDVPHGLTSCVLLAPVLRWVGDAAGGKQRVICEAMGREGADAASAVADLVASLGLPARLRDVGVRQELLATIAERTLHDPLTANCARKVESASQVREVLEMAW
ncbi:iron-containing alcohol dehydrogenase [Variovorax sp. 770b2]|uniref:iron-containing alcohol dehydrogenase n=1 Tax=Variovorax sp. 770b2 TaxID=1566271 RepID=UPI0011606806|nr:iron-containing alcohol dehydrogenase [Variovorax sp. 770b2]